MAILFTLDKVLAERKMKSVQLAKKVGCTVQTISRIKNGRVRAFRVETIDTLCKVLACQPGDLMCYLDDDEARALYGDQFIDDYLDYLRG